MCPAPQTWRAPPPSSAAKFTHTQGYDGSLRPGECGARRASGVCGVATLVARDGAQNSPTCTAPPPPAHHLLRKQTQQASASTLSPERPRCPRPSAGSSSSPLAPVSGRSVCARDGAWGAAAARHFLAARAAFAPSSPPLSPARARRHVALDALTWSTRSRSLRSCVLSLPSRAHRIIRDPTPHATARSLHGLHLDRALPRLQGAPLRCWRPLRVALPVRTALARLSTHRARWIQRTLSVLASPSARPGARARARRTQNRALACPPIAPAPPNTPRPGQSPRFFRRRRPPPPAAALAHTHTHTHTLLTPPPHTPPTHTPQKNPQHSLAATPTRRSSSTRRRARSRPA